MAQMSHTSISRSTLEKAQSRQSASKSIVGLALHGCMLRHDHDAVHAEEDQNRVLAQGTASQEESRRRRPAVAPVNCRSCGVASAAIAT